MALRTLSLILSHCPQAPPGTFLKEERVQIKKTTAVTDRSRTFKLEQYQEQPMKLMQNPAFNIHLKKKVVHNFFGSAKRPSLTPFLASIFPPLFTFHKRLTLDLHTCAGPLLATRCTSRTALWLLRWCSACAAMSVEASCAGSFSRTLEQSRATLPTPQIATLCTWGMVQNGC